MSARAAVSTASHPAGGLQCAILADAQTVSTQTIHWALAVIVFRRPLCYTVRLFVKTKNITLRSSTHCNRQMIILIMHINLYCYFFCCVVINQFCSRFFSILITGFSLVKRQIDGSFC